MRPAVTAAAGAVAVAACAAGLLTLGPGGGAAPDPASSAAGAAGGDRADARAKRADPAAAELRTARLKTRRTPTDPTAWTRLAAAELEQARSTLAAERLDAAERALRRSLSLKPKKNYPAVTGMGQLANARHEFDRARQYGERSTRMAPQRPDGYAVLADAQIQLGHYGAARRAAQRMLDLSPGSAAYARAAYDLETHGRDADAAVALHRSEQAAESPGETAFAAARAGDLAWAQGQLRRAKGHFTRALRADPTHPYALAGRARLRQAHGEPAAALRLYRSLTDRVPAPQFLLEHLEARLATGHGRDAAARSLRAALDAQLRLARADGGPVDPYLARYAADHGDPRTAVTLLRREARASDGVIVADALGWALHRAGEDAEALDWVRRAARTGWHNPQFACHRGIVEQALGLPEGRRHLAAGRKLNSRVWGCRSDTQHHAAEGAEGADGSAAADTARTGTAADDSDGTPRTAGDRANRTGGRDARDGTPTSADHTGVEGAVRPSAAPVHRETTAVSTAVRPDGEVSR